MAVVDLNTTEWHNADNLLVKFGTGEVKVTRGGQFGTVAAGRHVVSVMLDLATLPTAASGDEQIIADNVLIPNGAFIEKVEVFVVEEPTTAGSPNLDLGLVDQDRSTEIDFNGLLAAADAFETGTDIGTLVVYDTTTTESGALVGTVLTNTGLLTASADTADWTDGTLEIRVYYMIPLAADL
jgi:hypothetical protein